MDVTELCSNARSAMRQGSVSSAIELAERALDLEASLLDVYAGLGGIARDARNWTLARELMARDYAARRMSSSWQLRYAEVLVETGQLPLAIEIVSSVYSAEPCVCDGYARLGYVFRRHHQPHVAAEIMQRDAVLGRLSPSWEIRYYRMLAESGQIREAQAQLERFCDCHQDQPINWNVWLAVIQLSLDMGIPLNPETILDRALKDNPDDSADILVAFGEVWQKSVLIRWMAEKGRSALSNVQKADSLEIPKADWTSAARVYERLITDGVDLGKTGELWKAVRARLFVAGEQLNADDRQGAEGTISSTLRMINPDLSPSDAQRSSFLLMEGNDGSSGQAKRTRLLDTMPDSSSGSWLALADVLQWHGFFREGYEAYERSICAAFHDADSPHASAFVLQQAFRAAMTDGCYDRAMSYVDRLPVAAAADCRRYLALHGVADDRVHDQGRTPEMLAHDLFFQYLEGKSVAIVGPAPTGEDCGKEIDGFDVVIRTCYTGRLPGHADEFGARTDISNYAKLISQQWAHEPHRPDYLQQLSFYTYSPVISSAGFLHEDIKLGKARPVWFNPHFYHKYPNAIQRIIYDVLQYPVGRVKVFKSNFFLSSKSYTDRYVRPDYSESKSGGLSTQMPFRQTLLYGHDLISQLAFVRNLWTAGVIDVDDSCRNVLELSNAEYMAGIEQLHGA